MSDEYPLVFILLLNWNGWQDTVECVESCRKLSYPNFRLVVLDNGSTDGSEDRLRTRFPDTTVIQTGKNLGFAGGNNFGIRYALAQGAEYIWLLNNDTVVDAPALTQLVAVARSQETIGLAGSKILDYRDRRRINCAGGRISRLTGFPYNRGRNETDRGQFDTVQDVDYVLGCSCLVKSAVIKSAGFMDDRFFLYFEDTDWNFRIRRKGWRIVLAPQSIVRHKEASSVGLHSPRMAYYFCRNSLLFVQKTMPWILPLTLLRSIQVFVFGSLRRREFQSAKMGFHGILDFFRRRFGRSALFEEAKGGGRPWLNASA